MMSATGNKRGRGGFTFIELFIVLLLISVLSVAALPRFKRTAARFELDETVKNLQMLMRYVQTKAIADHSMFVVRFTPATEKCEVFLKKDDSFVPVAGRLAKGCKIPQAVQISILPVSATDIYVLPDGSSDSATITFTDTYGYSRSLIHEAAFSDYAVK